VCIFNKILYNNKIRSQYFDTKLSFHIIVWWCWCSKINNFINLWDLHLIYEIKMK